MAYIQIATRCNMTCEHCMFACTAHGEDMTTEIYQKAIQLFRWECLTLGGGEPTLHPNFRTFLIDAIAECDEDSQVGTVTNGTHREHSLLIAKLAKKGVIWGALSVDEWHDAVDREIVEAFRHPTRKPNQWGKESTDLREIRSVDRILPQGRAVKMLEEEEYEKQGCCGGWHVCPNGDVKPCSCLDSPVLFNLSEMSLEEAQQTLSEIEDEHFDDNGECWQDWCEAEVA